MQFSTDDTIAAIASARGGALRGILRVSGPAAAECVDRCVELDSAGGNLAGLRLAQLSRPGVISGRWRLSEGSAELPGEIYWWPDERSYTRQPTVEFHTLGSPPLLELALAAVCVAGARLARPGEFTLRAFLAGRIDLTQAEAVLGVIDAVGTSDLDTALQQLAGGLAGPLADLRNRLLNVLAHVEAGLDFVTEDIEFIGDEQLARELAEASAVVEELAQRMASRGQTGEEPRVVLVGRPNAGKSSLFNVLCGENAALVADQPGTTRDYVLRRVVWDGLTCQLIDTAGLDSAGIEAGDAKSLGASVEVAAAAQDHSTQQRRQAAVELLCLDATRPLDAWENAQRCGPPAVGTVRVIVLTKTDAAGATDGQTFNWLGGDDTSPPLSMLPTSSVTGEGIEALRRAVVAAVRGRLAASEGVVAATAVRCRESLRRAAESLERARNLAPTGQDELIAAELRLALEDLGEVAGTVYTDDVLDRIFSRFCIGK